MLSIQCGCGRQVAVRETQAGTVIQCVCGGELAVPSLSVLRRQLGNRQSGSVATDRARIPDEANGLPPAAGQKGRILVFLTHPQTLPNRISFDAASHYIAACDRVIEQYFSQAEHPWDLDVQVAMALLPDGQKLVEIQAQPAILPTLARDELACGLRAIPSPPVADGPVAFAMRRPVRRGAPPGATFAVPFGGLGRDRGNGELEPSELEQILMQAAGLAPQPRAISRAGRLARIWANFLDRAGAAWRRVTPATAADVTESSPPAREPSPWEREIAVALNSGSLDHVAACLQRYPTAAVLQHCLAMLYLNAGRFAESVDAFTRLLELAPDNAAAYAGRGRAHCLAGSMQRGLADYTAALDKDPKDAETRAARARLYLELEAWETAETDLNHAVELAPIQPRMYVERARARYAQRKIADAQRDLQQALYLDPYCVEACMLSGWILQHLPDAAPQDTIKALEYYSQALAIEPHNPHYLVQRAEVYASQGKYALSIADCDRALELDGNSAVAFGVRGYAHQQLDSLPEALADCTRAIELGLQSAAVHLSRAVAYGHAGELDLALADCDTSLELAPDYAAAFHFRGMLRLGQGDVQSATQDFAEASRLAPNWSTPREYGADAHRLLEQFEAAIEQYTRALELEPGNLAAHIGRALAWMETRQLDKAWDDLTAALHLDDHCPAAYFHRAELSLQREQYNQALVDLDRAIQLDAQFTPAYHARARIYMQLRRHQEAVADFNRLIELLPAWPAAYLGRANAWIHLGEPHQAAADYQEAAHLDPGSIEELIVHRLTVEAHHLYQQEDYEGAVAKATEALAEDPHSLPALATRAVSYWYGEHFVEALDDYSRLLELHADASFVYVARGQVYAELGEYEQALIDLDQAVSAQRQAASETGLAYALSGRGLARAGLQRLEEAQRDFDESIRLRPHNAWVHYNRGLVYHALHQLPLAAASFRQAILESDPPLNKRKRERAQAFLQQYAM